MQFKAICFDLDGTLLNTIEDLANCTNEILSKKGFPEHKLDAFPDFVGNGLKYLISCSLPKENRKKQIISECLKDFEKVYEERLHENTRPYKGIPELLDELSNLKIRLTILSNKPHKYTLLAVNRLLTKWKFEIVLGQSKKIPKKPAPDGFIFIKNKLQLPSTDFVLLGDSGTDMKTALVANCFPVGVLWGFRSEKELKDNGARAIIKNPLELLEIIK